MSISDVRQGMSFADVSLTSQQRQWDLGCRIFSLQVETRPSRLTGTLI